MSDEADPIAVEAGVTKGEAVPYSRFAAVVKERNDRRQAVTAAEERAAKAEAERVAIETSWSTKAAAWEDERAALAVGLREPEAIEVAKAVHRASGATDPFSKWLPAAVSAETGPPRALAAYLTPAPAQTPPKPAAPAPAPAASTPAVSTAQPSTTTPQQASLEEIRAAKEYGERTKDWSRFKALTGRG